MGGIRVTCCRISPRSRPSPTTASSRRTSDKREAQGLEGILQEVFPIESYDGQYRLDYCGYELLPSRFDTTVCRQLRLTYGKPFRVEVTALDPILEVPSSLVFGGKEVAGWARELGAGLLEIKGGMLEGITLSASDVDELSKSPSREELIGQIAGLLLSPGATIAGSLLGPGGLVAGSIEAIADGEAEEETEAETEEAAVEEADTGEEETGAAEEPEVASEEPEAAAEEPEAASEEPEAAAEADSDADGEGGQEPESEESEA